jgi:hypothetical protein
MALAKGRKKESEDGENSDEDTGAIRPRLLICPFFPTLFPARVSP